MNHTHDHDYEDIYLARDETRSIYSRQSRDTIRSVVSR